ncbi:unnamed protein product [[Candida] boidinii]|uniref:U2 small nuclear ribonucleoprotein A' n=1 Tax=Candida boidinii TaxID=5477 RepID=A0A9W6SYP9_CANBO|nr:hypothetical protein B5S30_g4795 [[Candida] boidinii]GME68873.1 unnamed protein product [[Candida] boidinii]GMG20123.1 unnamed protein product [[Candida] boidinii]
MKLTPTLILDAPTYMNPVGERTLSLRSLEIQVIENLGVTNDMFEVIDLTDNEIRVLNGLPNLLKLKTLLLGRNSIQVMQLNRSLNSNNNNTNNNNNFNSHTLTNLKTLSLIENNLKNLHDLIGLRNFKNLENLYLNNNPVTKLRNYRLFVIWLLPNLKILDFNKIKEKERSLSSEYFGKNFENKSDLAEKILNSSSNEITLELLNSINYDINSNTLIEKDDLKLNKKINRLSGEEKLSLQQQLENATTLDEIERLENLIKNDGN